MPVLPDPMPPDVMPVVLPTPAIDAGDQGSDPAAVRDRVVRVLRAELVPVAVDSARFDREIAAH